VEGTNPQLGNDAGSLLWDLVMRDTDAGVPGSAATGDAALTLGSSSVMGPGVSGLYLSGSLGFPPPPINWRWVRDEVESTCSWVTTTERLFHDTVASVNQNILRLIRVSLKREEDLTRIPLDVHALLMEVTLAWEAATTVEAIHITVVLAIETSA
jgi:hypothetical protein